MVTSSHPQTVNNLKTAACHFSSHVCTLVTACDGEGSATSQDIKMLSETMFPATMLLIMPEPCVRTVQAVDQTLRQCGESVMRQQSPLA